MRITYDAKIDALYIRLWDAPAPLATQEVGAGVYLDFTKDDRLAGLEVLDASAHLPAAVLATIGRPSSPRTLAELEAEFGVTAETWKKLAQRGRVAATKRGRDWVVERADAANYLESRAASGRPARKKKARRVRHPGIRL